MKYDDIVECCEYPRGGKFYRVKPCHKFIGNYDKVEDGFLVNGKRKAVKTEDEAVRQIIAKRIQEIDNERKYLSELLTR